MYVFAIGVYQHVKGRFLGGHAIKLIGWGIEYNHKYTYGNTTGEYIYIYLFIFSLEFLLVLLLVIIIIYKVCKYYYYYYVYNVFLK